jgi:hypothetical protein
MIDEDELEDYAGKVAATITAAAAAIYSIISGIAAGLWSFASGLVTLDPTFILSGDWFTFGRLFAGTVGPAFFPAVPWLMVVGVLGLGFLAVLLYRRSRKRSQA